MLNRSELRVRDPYIVLHEGTYYLYCTTGERTLSYYVSDDLEHWDLGGTAFEIPDDSWAYKDVWAAEVHRYKGEFYLFVSLLGKNGLRGTQVARSSGPEGPFVPLVNRGVTPLERSCIDGTLYVDGAGVPYIVYSLDWPDNYVAEKNAYVGELWAARLTADLSAMDGEPWRLFSSDESPISKATPHHIEYGGKQTMRYGSDAPFLQHLSDGRLLLTWSPYLENNYVVLSVISQSGDLHGPWIHVEPPLFDRNGGHAMFFRDKQDRLIMSLHAPERHLRERANLFVMGERDGNFVILEEL